MLTLYIDQIYHLIDHLAPSHRAVLRYAGVAFFEPRHIHTIDTVDHGVDHLDHLTPNHRAVLRYVGADHFEPKR